MPFPLWVDLNPCTAIILKYDDYTVSLVYNIDSLENEHGEKTVITVYNLLAMETRNFKSIKADFNLKNKNAPNDLSNDVALRFKRHSSVNKCGYSKDYNLDNIELRIVRVPDYIHEKGIPFNN